MRIALVIIAAASGIQLTGPDGQRIDLNPNQYVTTREPRVGDHFGKDVRCLINTTDGKFVTVTETCAEVRRRLGLP